MIDVTSSDSNLDGTFAISTQVKMESILDELKEVGLFYIDYENRIVYESLIFIKGFIEAKSCLEAWLKRAKDGGNHKHV